MEEGMVGEVKKQDVVGRWNYPPEYSALVWDCGTEYMQLNSDGTALMVQYDSTETHCQRDEFQLKWSMSGDTIYMKMNGQLLNTLKIIKLDATTMRVQPNGGNSYTAMVFTRDVPV